MTVICFALGAMFLLGSLGSGSSMILFIVIGIVFSLLGIRSIRRRKSFSARLKSWESENEVYQTTHAAEEKALSEAKKKRSDALEKARSLV
jgi:membrane protein implicated in regulation of membrane protease activity